MPKGESPAPLLLISCTKDSPEIDFYVCEDPTVSGDFALTKHGQLVYQDSLNLYPQLAAVFNSQAPVQLILQGHVQDQLGSDHVWHLAENLDLVKYESLGLMVDNVTLFQGEPYCGSPQVPGQFKYQLVKKSASTGSWTAYPVATQYGMIKDAVKTEIRAIVEEVYQKSQEGKLRPKGFESELLEPFSRIWVYNPPATGVNLSYVYTFIDIDIDFSGSYHASWIDQLRYEYFEKQPDDPSISWDRMVLDQRLRAFADPVMIPEGSQPDDNYRMYIFHQVDGNPPSINYGYVETDSSGHIINTSSPVPFLADQQLKIDDGGADPMPTSGVPAIARLYNGKVWVFWTQQGNQPWCVSGDIADDGNIATGGWQRHKLVLPSDTPILSDDTALQFNFIFLAPGFLSSKPPLE